MKTLLQRFLVGFCTVSVLLFTVACEKDNDRVGGDEENDRLLYQPILENYVNTTILPTYKSLAEAAISMREAVRNFEIDPASDVKMQAVADAWMEARIYWELSEAFLFGPISEDGYDIDGHIDSWPLEVEQIEKEIENIRQGGNELTGKEAWSDLDAEVIGFHVTEYLIYRNGATRPATDLDKAQLVYLVAATDALVWDCALAYVAWVGENASANITNVMKENQDVVDHYNSLSRYQNFGSKFINGTAYPSWRATVDEISAGAVEIADEVGATKIAEPYEEGNVLKVESWYSWHSLDDYQNNILSIKNAYLGGVDNNTRPSANTLSSYIASVDKSLDTEIKEQIEDCIAKIKNIGKDKGSFYEVVRTGSNKTEVDAAVEACGDLAELFNRVSKILE